MEFVFLGGWVLVWVVFFWFGEFEVFLLFCFCFGANLVGYQKLRYLFEMRRLPFCSLFETILKA